VILDVWLVLDLTALILTFNEKENIDRTLAALHWVPRIIVLDSFSTDATCEIARSFPNVVLKQRKFDTHASQWNYGVSLAEAPWLLALDADFFVPEEFRREVESLKPSDSVVAYAAGFRFLIAGKALRSSIYPPRTVLFKRGSCQYIDEGHTQVLKANGEVILLQSRLDHDDRKPLSRWVVSQDAYARLEARHLLLADREKLKREDQLRLGIFYAPPIMFFYLLFVRGLILDGWRGWFYVMQRVVAECLLSLRLVTEKHALENNNFSAGDSP
jgi:glycosyltransferase involved in cell wall biosynthesis